MELRPTKNTAENGGGADIESRDGVEERLNTLLAVNAETERERSLYRNDRERLEAEMMLHPMPLEKAFAYFGFMIGSMPPAAVILKILFTETLIRPVPIGELAFLALFMLAGLATGVVGYFTGKHAARIVRLLDKFSASNRILLLPLVGIAWGGISGAAGGLLLFVFGAIYAGIIGGVLGAVTVPIFAGLTKMTARGDAIDRGHFLPIAFGITLTICSQILGF